MIKKAILFIGVMGFFSQSYAQQESQYSMYMFNQLLINPGVTGTEDYMDTKLGYRAQWVGVADAPKNFYGTFHTPIQKNKPEFEDVKPMPWHGLGGFATGETTGPISKYKMYGSYAYHLPINNNIVFSLGTFLGFQNYNVNSDKLRFGDNEAENTRGGNNSAVSPDGSIGGWLYSKNLYVGASALQIFNNKVKVSDGTNNDSKLNRHYIVTAGYKIKLNENWALVPSFLAKALSPAPIAIDLNTKVRYQDKIWVGLSYRNKDAAVLLVGMTFDQRIDIGYSYDYSISDLRKYSSGSHEILVGFHLPKKKTQYTNTYFW
jgi:type IX secretion system PorP/SprF family membrane protein